MDFLILAAWYNSPFFFLVTGAIILGGLAGAASTGFSFVKQKINRSVDAAVYVLPDDAVLPGDDESLREASLEVYEELEEHTTDWGGDSQDFLESFTNTLYMFDPMRDECLRITNAETEAEVEEVYDDLDPDLLKYKFCIDFYKTPVDDGPDEHFILVTEIETGNSVALHIMNHKGSNAGVSNVYENPRVILPTGEYASEDDIDDDVFLPLEWTEEDVVELFTKAVEEKKVDVQVYDTELSNLFLGFSSAALGGILFAAAGYVSLRRDTD